MLASLRIAAVLLLGIPSPSWRSPSAKGAPVPGALVWSVGSPAVPCAKAGADGSFQITVEKEGLAPATVSVQVSPGAVAAVEIELRPLQ